MSLKSGLVSVAKGLSQIPPVRAVLFHPSIRVKLQQTPGLSAIYGRGWDRLHPFDTQFGTDTSGFVPTEDLPNSPFSQSKIQVYGGSQPHILRTALKTLPSLEGFTFVDLGCGKGRPMLIASAFPFKELIGVELSAPLADAARKNVEIFRTRTPALPPMRVETGDAAAFAFPSGNLVVYLYNPFGEEVIRRVVAAIESALNAEPRTLYVVYYNPVFGECFDQSSRLKRYYAATIPYSDDERGFGPDDSDPVIIWQNGSLPPLKGADARIITTKPGTRVALE